MAKQRRFPTTQTVIVPFPKTFTDHRLTLQTLIWRLRETHQNIWLYGSPRNLQRLVAVHNMSKQKLVHWIVADGPEMSDDSPYKLTVLQQTKYIGVPNQRLQRCACPERKH